MKSFTSMRHLAACLAFALLFACGGGGGGGGNAVGPPAPLAPPPVATIDDELRNIITAEALNWGPDDRASVTLD